MKRALPLALALCLCAAAQAESPLDWHAAAQAAAAPYHNAVYLLLRIAGAVWIAVEWVAAVVLVWCYWLLRARAARLMPGKDH